MKPEKFRAWLTKRGAVMLDATSQWEVIRFKTANGISIVYRNLKEELTFTGESQDAYTAYCNNKHWKAKDRKRQQLRERKSDLANRDGKKCFFCNDRLNFDKLTIEHILSIRQGGTDNNYNLCLACRPCNQAVGNLPITKKILFRDEKQKERQELDNANIPT